jgi:hypothetical protein
MKAIVLIGGVLAALVGLAGLIMFVTELRDPLGPVGGATVLGADFLFILLLAMVHGLADIRGLLKLPLSGPAPVISEVSPPSYPATNYNQSMTIKGSNFQSGASLTFVNPKGIHIDGAAHKLTYVSTTQLSYQFNNAGDAGPWSVIVNNPGGQGSNPVSFTVTAAGKQ